MKKLIKHIRLFWAYMKYRKDINAHYGCAIKEGYCQDETYNWKQRVEYYLTAD